MRSRTATSSTAACRRWRSPSSRRRPTWWSASWACSTRDRCGGPLTGSWPPPTRCSGSRCRSAGSAGTKAVKTRSRSPRWRPRTVTSRTPSRRPKPCGSPAWRAPRSASRSCSPAPSALRCSSRWAILIGASVGHRHPRAPQEPGREGGGHRARRARPGRRALVPGVPPAPGRRRRRSRTCAGRSNRRATRCGRRPQPGWSSSARTIDVRHAVELARRGARVQRRVAQPRRGRRRDRAAPQGAGRPGRARRARRGRRTRDGVRALWDPGGRPRRSADRRPVGHRRDRAGPGSTDAGRAGGSREHGARGRPAARRPAAAARVRRRGARRPRRRPRLGARPCGRAGGGSCQRPPQGGDRCRAGDARGDRS